MKPIIWISVVTGLVVIGTMVAVSVWLDRPLPEIRQPNTEAVEFPFKPPPDPSKKNYESWGSFVKETFGDSPMDAGPVAYDESYRLVIMPTFDHPILIRVSHKGDESALKITVLDGQGGYKIGTVMASEERQLTADEWSAITKLIDEADFWQTPKNGNEAVPPDGADFSIEGRRGSTYHEIHRGEPQKGLNALCGHLLHLSGHADTYLRYLTPFATN